MGEAGQRYAKPDAMPAVALRFLTHALICNHISHTDGRHVCKEQQTGASHPGYCRCSFHQICFSVLQKAALFFFLKKQEVAESNGNPRSIQLLNRLLPALEDKTSC